MTNIIWYVNAERQKILDALQEIPECGKRKRSEVIEMALREYVQKHGKSNNAQTQIEMFDKESINSVPHIYRREGDWQKFYSLLNKETDYKEVDKQLNMILRLHEKKYKEFQ